MFVGIRYGFSLAVVQLNVVGCKRHYEKAFQSKFENIVAQADRMMAPSEKFHEGEQPSIACPFQSLFVLGCSHHFCILY
ncbi:hypothetical protein [Anoxybacillus sp. FSL W8-1294]|uniref:hypothetical protein n=1 Tax=Anoxybacillus sp. FSL W8-1294 TaxID=2954655 RepID=UPI0030D13B51